MHEILGTAKLFKIQIPAHHGHSIPPPEYNFKLFGEEISTAFTTCCQIRFTRRLIKPLYETYADNRGI